MPALAGGLAVPAQAGGQEIAEALAGMALACVPGRWSAVSVAATQKVSAAYLYVRQ